LGFLRRVPDDLRVGREAGDPADLHPAEYPALDRGPFVAGEVVASAAPQEGHDAPEVVGGNVGIERSHRLLAAADLGDALDQLRYRRDEADDAGGDRILRHHRELGLGRVLGELQRIVDLTNRHLRAGRENLAHHARVLGRQMHDDDVGEPEIVGDLAEEGPERLHPARRGADSADRNRACACLGGGRAAIFHLTPPALAMSRTFVRRS